MRVLVRHLDRQTNVLNSVEEVGHHCSAHLAGPTIFQGDSWDERLNHAQILDRIIASSWRSRRLHQVRCPVLTSNR